MDDIEVELYCVGTVNWNGQEIKSLDSSIPANAGRKYA